MSRNRRKERAEKDGLGEKKKNPSLERLNRVLFLVFLVLDYAAGMLEVSNLPNVLVNFGENGASRLFNC